MVRVIEDPENWGRFHRRWRNRTYPWDEWSDGRWREAVRGEDFDCIPQSFVTAMYKHAQKYGKNVNATTDGDAVLFRITVAHTKP